MSIEMRAHVVGLLESYASRERQIALLHYELEHLPYVSDNEMINSMSLGHGDNLGHSPGHVSNKTMYIAFNYQEQADKLNAEPRDEIVSHLRELEQEQKRLRYYVTLLEERQAEAIRLSYFDSITQREVASRMQVSVRTIQVIKAQAIDVLVRMYSYMEELH